MEAENRFEYCKLKITVTTPVHIGDQNTLGAKEYFYDSPSRMVYFINKPEWHKFIIKHGLFDAYARYMSAPSNGMQNQNLLSWLEEQKYTLQDVQQVIRGQSCAETDGVSDSCNIIKFHIRQAKGSVYIPGSSIKGFLRTALLYRLLQQEPGIKNSYWQSISELDNFKKNFKSEVEKTVKKLEAALLHKLELRNNDRYVPQANAVCSVMRGLSIGDACALGKVKTALLQKTDISLSSKNYQSAHSLPLFRESVLPGTEFSCNLKLDKAMLGTVGIENAEQLLQAAQDFYNFTLDLWQSCDFGMEGKEALSRGQGGNMFLGGGSGFHTKTLIWALAPNKEEALTFTRKLFKKHRHWQLDKELSPRTLKIAQWQGKKYLQGTARAELL